MNVSSEQIQQLSTEECAWKLGRVLGFAAIESAQGTARGRVAEAYHEAMLLAAKLEVALPSLPTLTGERLADEATAVRYLLREAGAVVADGLFQRFGGVPRGLFEGALKLQILFLGYHPKDPLTLALRDALLRAFQAAELPERLWRTLDARIQEGVPRDALRLEVEQTEKSIWTHLLSEEQMPTSRESALASWELGRALGNAAVCYVLQLSEGAVRAMRLVASEQLERLGVRRAPPAFPEPSADNAASLRGYTETARASLAATLAARFDAAHGAIFMTALLTQLMPFVYTSPESMAGFAESLAQTGLPVGLWQEPLAAVRRMASQDEIHESLKKIEAQLSAKLSAPPPAPPAPVVARPAPAVKRVSSAPPKRAAAPIEASSRSMAWRLGFDLGISALLHSQGDTEKAQPYYEYSAARAEELGVPLAALPSLRGELAADTAGAMVFLMKTAGVPLAERLEKRYGASHSALFEAALKILLLSKLYSAGDDLADSVAKAIHRAALLAMLPEHLWMPLLDKIARRVSFEEVKGSVQETTLAIGEHLSRQQASIRSGGATALVRFERDASSILVEARLSDKATVTLVYDTGATNTMIDAETARRLGLSLEKARYVEVMTGNGVVCRPLVTLSSIEVGDARVEGPLEVTITDKPLSSTMHGLLGLNFLRAFITEVDLMQGTILFKLRQG